MNMGQGAHGNLIVLIGYWENLLNIVHLGSC